MMNKFLRHFPGYAIGIYVATGIIDGVWNPIHWNKQQWIAAVLSGAIVLTGSWVWNRRKAAR